MLNDRILKNSPVLAGADSTANIIRGWLLDENKSRGGMLGVDGTLRVVSHTTFEHGVTQAAVGAALGEAVGASASGIVIYNVTPEGVRPTFSNAQIGKLAQACEALNLTLLDVMNFSPLVSKGWISARQQGTI